MSHRLNLMSLAFAMLLTAQVVHAQTTSIQFAFSDRFGDSPYLVGSDGPAHVVDGFGLVGGDPLDDWNFAGSGPGSTAAVTEPTGDLTLADGTVDMSGIAINLGVSVRQAQPDGNIDFGTNPRQTGSDSDQGLFDNLLWENRLFSGASNPDRPDDIAFQVTGLGAGTYRVYALTREPGDADNQLARTHDVFWGTLPENDVNDGDFTTTATGLVQDSVVASTDAGVTLDAGSDYLVRDFTINATNDTLAGIIVPTNSNFGAITGLQIVDINLLPNQGDVDLDGDTDIDDFEDIRANFFADTSALSPVAARQVGDLNGDGTVSVADFRIWKADPENVLPSSLTGAVSVVPEPTCLSLLALGSTVLAAMRRKRSC